MKGSNPKSKANLVAGKNSKNAKRTMLTLSPKAREAIAQVGNNNMSEGVEQLSRIYEKMTQERLFQQSPVFARCKHLLEVIASNPGSVPIDQIEAVLFDMQALLT